MTPVGGGGLWTRRLTGIEAPAPMTPVGAKPPHPRAAKGRPYGKARRVVAQASFISAQEPPLCGGWPRNAPAGAISARWADSPSRAPQAGSGGLTVQAPLKRGLSPPPGGDWGFLVSCRDRGEGRGKKPSVTASPCHLPFQGRFWRADIVRPYEWMRPMSEKRRAGLGPAPTKERAESSRPTGMGCTPKIAGRGWELYISIHLFPKFVPRHAKNRAGCIIGYTLPGVLCGKAHLRGGEGSCRRLTAAARGPEPEV